MKKKLITCLLLCLPIFAHASSGVQLAKADINLENKDSLRAGAKLFVNYCLSCHSASFMRYNRMGKDLSMSDDQVVQNLMFVANFENLDEGEPKKVGDLMTIAMKAKDAKKYFGTLVPDLTVVARVRGADWLYSYLTSFYADEKRPFGVNNTVFSSVAMPHVLWELDGEKQLVARKDKNGNEIKDHNGHVEMELVKTAEGTMSDVEYKRAVNDLVNFMVYMSEPIKLERQNVGIFVMFFLLIFFLFAYLLKKEYWKDIH